MKQKLTVLLLAALMLLSLAACTQAEMSAYDIYTQANEKLTEAGSMEADIEMTMLMSAEGQEIPIDMSGNVKQVMRGPVDVDMAMDMQMSMMGMDIEMMTYYTDGYTYVETQGVKQKVATDVQDAVNQANYNVQFPESAVKDTDVEETDTGKTIRFTLDGAAMSDILAGALTNTTGAEGAEVTMQDVKMTVMVDKENNLKSLEMVFSMVMSAQGEKMDVETTMMMDILKIGDVKVELPADLDSYTEVAA